jgi:HK97 family phage major capsid protein/HK97 family phage prohead protease
MPTTIDRDKDTMQLGLMTRSFAVRDNSVDEEARTVELSFSSEDSLERWFGIEILSHEKGAVNMDFMASGSAPLLAQHNHADQLGVVDKAWLEESVGSARVRFGRSSRASEFFDDVRDGIRKNTSVGYYVQEMKLQEEREDAPDIYLVTRWKPVEVSIVAVPADETVGIRSADDEIETTILRTKEAPPMPDVIEKITPPAPAPKPEPVIDIKAIRDQERKRQADILAIGNMADMGDEAQKAIETDETVDQFRGRAFDRMIDNRAEPAVDMAALSEPEKRDLRGYSFLKALREASEGKLTGLESEMHTEAVKQFRDTGVTVQGTLAVPYQALALSRDLTVGTDDQGGYTVATNLHASSFIELLQNKIKVREMGATVLDNLVGDVAIPSQATGATGTWEGENDANAESSPTFGQVALTPNRVGTYTEVSKKLLVQSSLSVENIVRNLLADALALAMDLAALHGTGSGDQPTGIAATSGIGSVAGGTNGLAPTWAHMVELETDVAVANADVGRMGYLTNAKVRGKLKQIFTNATYGEIPIWEKDGSMNGYRAEVTNQVSSALTKGSASAVCSAIFFGNWADLLLAFWGGLDMVVDPYSLATTNLTRITANTYADVGIRHAASFSAMLDALTT